MDLNFIRRSTPGKARRQRVHSIVPAGERRKTKDTKDK
jgi:hypothetical protein